MVIPAQIVLLFDFKLYYFVLRITNGPGYAFFTVVSVMFTFLA